MTTEDVDRLHRSVPVSDVLDVSASLVAGALLVLSALGESGTPRLLLALAFAFFVPGRAIVTNWQRMARWSEVAMPIVLSLAVLTLLATLALWARLWKPIDLFQIEAFLSLGGLAVGVMNRGRQRSAQRLRRLRPRSQSGRQ